jgi:hypothetical protein
MEALSFCANYFELAVAGGQFAVSFIFYKEFFECLL